MEAATVQQARPAKNLLTAILISGLIVGTFDLTAASIQTLIYQGNLIRLFKYIATGVYGKEALDGGSAYALQGVLFHYCIAMIWTIAFFLIYPKIAWLSKNRILTGILYGLIVWLIMNRVVVPLSNTSKNPFNISRAMIAAGILIVAIGIPLSYMANAYYRRNTN